MTSIKLPFVIKIFVLSIFEWLFYTGFTVKDAKFVMSPQRWGGGHIVVFWCIFCQLRHQSDTFMCARYLMNYWTDWDRICRDIRLGNGDDLIKFLWSCHNFQGHSRAK